MSCLLGFSRCSVWHGGKRGKRIRKRDKKAVPKRGVRGILGVTTSPIGHDEPPFHVSAAASLLVCRR